jgi:trans-2-enoyl-CoA reductase
MSKVSAIVIHEHGTPERVARCEELDLPSPQPGEVRVRVLFSPINPADLNVLEGRYPKRPTLPGIPGVEGVGVIEETGERVLLPGGFGAWREAGNVRADALVPVPHGVPDEQAAMLRINPPTAERMLHDFVALEPGGWILQNAGNSAVGRCVIQLAHQYGWRTASVIRRPELVDELRALGGDAVLLEGDDFKDRLAAATGGATFRLALNAVGGESASRLAGELAPGGVIVTYGAMGRAPLRIPNGQLIFQDIAWRGFWVSRWYEQAGPAVASAMLRKLGHLAAGGLLHAPVEACYPLSDSAAALAHAQRSGRAGKILFRCTP